MKYTFEIKLKAVKSIKKGILIDEPYNKISRQWRDRVKYWEKNQVSINRNIPIKSIVDWVKLYS